MEDAKQLGAEIDNLQWTGRALKKSDSLTRERLIELYKAELRKAFDDIGDEFDLSRDDIDFTDDGAVIFGEVEILPPGTVDTKHMAGCVKKQSRD
jgi:hypothetical protein